MTAVSKKKYTPEEYLELEREAPYKSEFFGGEIFPMGDFGGNTALERSGFSARHNAVRTNVSAEIGMPVRRTGCLSFSSDQRLFIPQNGFFGYPDLMVICGKPNFHDEDDTLTNPTLLVEVLSRSMFGYDRTEKLAWYQVIPTLREYLLLDCRQPGVELWRRSKSGFWTLVVETADSTQQLHLESVGISLLIADLYLNVDDLPPVVF